jgi:GTP pyrophosphokinase
VHDGVGVLIQIAQIFSERGINVTAMSSRSSKNGRATINVSFDINGRTALNKIIDKLRTLDCVYDIARTTG